MLGWVKPFFHAPSLAPARLGLRAGVPSSGLLESAVSSSTFSSAELFLSDSAVARNYVLNRNKNDVENFLHIFHDTMSKASVLGVSALSLMYEPEDTRFATNISGVFYGRVSVACHTTDRGRQEWSVLLLDHKGVEEAFFEVKSVWCAVAYIMARFW